MGFMIHTPPSFPATTIPAAPVASQALAPGGDAGANDGSQHPWLEDRGTKLTLLIAVDDDIGTVAQAVLRAGENTRGYPVLLEGLVRQWGGSCATIPPCLHCRQEITTKGVVQWCRTVRRPCPHCGKPH